VLGKAAESKTDSSNAAIHAPWTFQTTDTSHDYAFRRSSGPLMLQIHIPEGSPAIACGAEYELVLDRTVIYAVNHLFLHDGRLYADCDALFPNRNGPTQVSSVPQLSQRVAARVSARNRSTAGFIKDGIRYYGSPHRAVPALARYWHGGQWLRPEPMRTLYGHEELEPVPPARET
jgi:hypothetical protein